MFSLKNSFRVAQAARSASLWTSAARRGYSRVAGSNASKISVVTASVALGAGAATAALLYSQPTANCAWYDVFTGGKKEAKPVLSPAWTDAQKKIEDLISEDANMGPLFVRLAWHASGTYDAATKTGGSNGGLIRFPPECDYGANKGLNLAREALAPIKTAHPELSFADIATFAGAVAVEYMGGPKIPWHEGRTDYPDGSKCPADGRLPDASKDAVHIRDIFYRMGFNDREIVALIGAHTLGFCHADRSGYVGPWTRDPYGFDNDFYRLLLSEQWRIKKGQFPVQFEDASGELMMLPADIALIIDPNFRKYVELYANDSDVWAKDFAAAFGRLLNLGVPDRPSPGDK